MNRVAVIGAGAWGTALAIQAARAGHDVVLWARDPVRAQSIAAERRNPRLPGAVLPHTVRVVHAMPEAELLLLAMPLQTLRSLAPRLPSGGVLVACCKGMETDTGDLPLEILAGLRPCQVAAVLTGPNFAGEVAAGLPTAAVIAAADAATRGAVATALSTPSFRLYGNDDPIGCQVGAAAKNVIAIAAGAVIGAGLGENARAALVTRGLAEMSRLAVALGGRAETVAGLSGLGDLLLTCTGPASRNFSLGVALGRKQALAEILSARNGSVAEGAATALALVARAGSLGVMLPICAAVASVIEGSTTVQQAIATLLARPPRDE